MIDKAITRPEPDEPRRAESGLTAKRDARLVGRAIRRGWYKGQRWPTEITASELLQLQKERELTMKEQASVATMAGLANGKTAHIHAKNVIAMEAQNMKDDEREDEQEDKQPGADELNVTNENYGQHLHQHIHVELTQAERQAHIRAIVAEAAAHDQPDIPVNPGEQNGHGTTPVEPDQNGSANGA